MLRGHTPSSLRLIARTNLGIRSGDFVSVRVIGRLVGRKWTVALMGRTYPAWTDVELVPGQRLRARVQGAGRRIVLQIRDEAETSAGQAKAFGGKTFVEGNEVLRNALLHSSLKTYGNIEARIARLVKKLGRERLGNERRTARVVALMLEKTMNPAARGARDLVRLLSCLDQDGGDQDGGNQDGGNQDGGKRFGRRERKRRGGSEERGKVAEAVRRSARRKSEGDEGGHPLQLFNHIRGGGESWFAVPFSFTTPVDTYSGLVKILFDVRRRSMRRLILDVPMEDEVMSFVLTPRSGGIKVRFHTASATRAERWRERIDRLQSKLRNHGVECDDSVYEEGLFDGFSYAWEDQNKPGLDITT